MSITVYLILTQHTELVAKRFPAYVFIETPCLQSEDLHKVSWDIYTKFTPKFKLSLKVVLVSLDL